jgi:hypothetical protein
MLDEVYSIQHYAIKFVSELQEVGGFSQVSSINKTDSHNITEILLKVALNTITLTPLTEIDVKARKDNSGRN